ncbi:MAG: hypothetical protein KatS3mg077_2855 [Candidatus Binatia bacterium]|nr:MAG: hypothetical protein KatS3mg077_2855 [Candidatus Binatia bacterium]
MKYSHWVVSTASLAALLCGVRGFADVRREIPARRPYITEIGEPYRISRTTLEREAAKMDALRSYLEEYGYPDYAEVQEIRPEWPWDSYEVRLYYLRRNVEVDFGRALTLPEAYPHLGILKFTGGIPASKRLEIELALNPPEPPPAPENAAAPAAEAKSAPAPKPSLEELVARVEAAADRAAAAAEDAVRQSEAAERAANRTVEIVDRLMQQTQARPQR